MDDYRNTTHKIAIDQLHRVNIKAFRFGCWAGENAKIMDDNEKTKKMSKMRGKWKKKKMKNEAKLALPS